MKLDFKLAATDDAGLLVDLYNASFFGDYQRFGTCPGYGKTFEMMEESIRLYPKHIILYDNRPVGYISCHSNAPQEYEIGCLCVIPEYQGKGIGTQAVQFVKNYYDDWKRLTLVTLCTSVKMSDSIRRNADFRSSAQRKTEMLNLQDF